MHKPIFLKNISLSFSNKTCFEDFSSTIYPGSRIAIIGRNGSGKSSLLKILNKELQISSGELIIPDELSIGYVPQTINDFSILSGGQRLNKKLSESLANSPDLLLLDEPTNHLDKNNRKSLIKMLERYWGTLIIVSHDKELLRNCVDILWHVSNDGIQEFTGSYDDYLNATQQKRASIEKELSSLNRDKKDAHIALMREQNRAAKSKAKGQKSINQKKWPTVVSKAKATRAEQTSGNKKSEIAKKKQHLNEQLSDLRLPEIILPKFSLTPENIGSGTMLSISGGNIGYSKNEFILKDIHIILGAKDRLRISGKNASGKSTLLRAITGQDQIFKTGDWHLPRPENIGYLDQHYSNLIPELSVIEHLKQARPDWSEAEIRKHLNNFLFRKNEEVSQIASQLSGGEKARLSLAIIAAKTPRLLLLDEITNNLDLETKDHVAQVLKEYPGAMIIASHDDDFVEDIRVDFVHEVVE